VNAKVEQALWWNMMVWLTLGSLGSALQYWPVP
jgi:hypothetical protein